MRYIDQPHLDEREDDPEAYEDSRRVHSRVENVQRRRPLSHNRSRHRTGGSQFLSDAHEQLAPFAGLIVTVALVTCAGLLFVMMASKRNSAELDEFALPGFRVELERDLESAEAPLAETEVGVEKLDPEAFEFVPVEAPEDEFPTGNAVSRDTGSTITQPVISEITESSEPLGAISFPVTSTPLALDLSKAIAPATDGLLELPAVAEREAPASSEPINR